MSRFCLKKEHKESDLEPVYLGHCNKWRMEFEGNSVWIVDKYDQEYFWSLDEDERWNIDELSSDEQNALLCAFRIAVRGDCMECPDEYSWLMDENADELEEYVRPNDTEDDRLFLGFYNVYGCRGRCTWPIDRFCHPELITESTRRAKMIGILVYEKPEAVPTNDKIMYSSVYPNPASTITVYNPAMELLRELYNFGHWTVNDRLYGDQIAIWEKVRKFLMNNGGTRG